MPFASVTIFWSTLLRVGAFLALAIALLGAVEPRDSRPLWIVAIAGVALGAYGFLQSVPLPLGLVALLSPGHAGHVEAARALVGPEVDVGAALSVAPEASRSAAMGWLAMTAAFVAAGICGRDRRRLKVLVAAFVSMAVLQVFFGIQRLFAGATSMWGVEVPGDPTRLRGTFINSDHLALYLEIALAVTFAWSYWATRRTRDERVTGLRVLEIAVPVVCWLLLFVGLAFTGSRAGLAVAVLATLAQGILLASSLRNWRLAPAGLLAGIVGLVIVGWIGLEQGLGRLLGTSSYEVAWNQRPVVYRATFELWKKFPVFGTGLGTFEQAFPTVQPESASSLVWGHAHNDWLELLATGGVLGSAVLLLGALVLARALMRVLRGSRSSTGRAIGLGALGALVAVALHEALDFGLAMPANAFTLAVMLGLAVGVSREYSSVPESLLSFRRSVGDPD